ncbi:hypothetical protein [Paenarthrobacter nitroguajacolicus]
MDVLRDWLPVVAILIAGAGFWLQVANRRDARRAAGLHVDSLIRDGRATILIQKIGDAPIFDVQVEEYAGRATRPKLLPLSRGEMTREDKPIRFAVIPNPSQQIAVGISYRTMLEGGRTVRFVYDAVGHRRLSVNVNVRSRLGWMPHQDLGIAGEKLEAESSNV